MSIQSDEKMSRSYASPADDRPQAPDAALVSDESGRLGLHVFWFAAALVLTLAGSWGVIGGWYLGLPGGGEIREDVFGDQRLTLRDLFVAIPHPDWAELPFAPRSTGGGFRVRDKFRSELAFREGTLAFPAAQPVQETPPPPTAVRDPFGKSAFDKGAFDKETFNKESFNKAAPSNSKQVQPQAQTRPQPKLPPEPIPYFTTSIASAAAVLELPLPLPGRGTCLAVRSDDRDSGTCLLLPADMPLNTPTVLDPPARAGTTYQQRLPLQFLGSVFPDQGEPASKLTLANFEAPGGGSDQLFAATLGTESGDPALPGNPAIWVGGRSGNIFRITTDPAGSALTTTRLNVPFAGAISFVAFASRDRGWIWTPSAGERGIVSSAAAQTFDGGASWQRLSYRWLPAPWVFVAFVLGALAFERGTRARIRQTPVATEKYIADHGVSDDPIGLNDDDALGLMPIARSMARFLRNTETRPTVAIAVTGPWGSGKTSLMNLVKEELNERDVRSVWFNAWHNQKEDNLLAALLAAIRAQAVPPLWTVSGFIYRLRVAWMRVGADPNATIALAVFALVAFAIVATHLDAAARILSQLADRIGALLQGQAESAAPASAAAAAGTPGAASAITSIGLSTGGITAMIYASKKLWDLFKPLKSIPADLLSTLSGNSSTKDIDQQLSFRYRFASEFAIFCDTLRRPPHPGLVIFIDDLDRCAPKQTVDILEAINFVTNAGRCFVVLGLDESRVKAAIADSYKDMTLRLDDDDPAKPPAQTAAELQRQKLADLDDFASHYLEKLIHLVVPVPKSREDSVELLLGLRPGGRPVAETPKWRKSLKVGFEMLGTVLVVAFLMSSAWLGLDLATRSLPTVAASSGAASPGPADAGKPSASAAGTGVGGTTGPVRMRPAPTGPVLTSADLADAGLTTRGVLGTVPPAAVVLAFALLLIIVSFQFLPRLQIEPVVSDGPEFKEALRIWLEGITKTRETPRAVKRFVNRLRFMAMRLRDLSLEARRAGGHPPLDETDLVALAVIGDLDKDCLGKSDDELRKWHAEGSDKKEDVGIILSSLQVFRRQFGRDPYDNEVALPTFRLLAGIVAEARGETESEMGARKA